MKSRRSKDTGAKTSAITRIWMGLAEESISRDGQHVDAAEAQKALDRAAEWMVAHLREHGILADAGRDGALRTLDFENEAACLEAHERLVAANDHQHEFTLRFVLRPEGVTILVVS
jgi:hypothetical protein